MNEKIYSILILLCLILLSRQALAWNSLSSEIDLRCQQTVKALDCEYRMLSQDTSPSITASSNDIVLNILENNQYSENKETTAILFLVDTSDPARKTVINKNKVHIKELLAESKPHYKIGLASFDKSLTIQSPIGTSNFLLSKSLDTIKATGRTTELYRSLLKAIEQLNSYDAQRKVIFLFSDGQAEDKAYFHSDITKASRKSGIIINSIGYPRSVALSVALQTIRRLSEETGGSFFETDMTYNLPKSYIKQAFNNIDNGGSFSIDLNKLYQSNKQIDFIKLTFKTNAGINNIKVPVKIKKKLIQKQVATKATEPVITEKVQAVKSTPSSVPVQIVTRQTSTQPINLWLWYGLPAAFIIIIVFILITLFLLWNRPTSNRSTDSKDDYRPYAYLIADDGTDTRYPITRTIWRIGRSKDNELSLDDTSISRRHAEIHRNGNGTFDIIDMNSMNGVYINNEKIGKAELHEGDTLEIGDFFMHFTQLASDYSLEESTVMQKTRTPSTH